MTNFVTDFQIKNSETKEYESLAITEIVSLDFIYEYMNELKKASRKVDESTPSHGRWNWEYFATKMIASLGNRYQKQRLIPYRNVEDIEWVKNDKYNTIYIIKIVVLEEAYSDFKANILDAFQVTVYESKDKEILFDDRLSKFRKNLIIQEED